MRTADLTTGSIPHHLFRLSTPVIWGILAAVSMQLVDIYFIAQLGPTNLTAISFTFPISMGLFHVLMGLSIATSSVSARLIGAGEHHALRAFTAHALLLAFVSGVVLVTLTYAMIGVIFGTMGANEAEMEIIHTYMGISLWGGVFITIMLVANAVMRANGDSFTPSAIMVGSALLNAILAWGLVFGHLGLPRMEVAGAALATVLSNTVSMLLSLYILAVRKGMIDRAHIGLMGLKASAQRLFIVAVPVGLTNLIPPFASGVIIALLATTGPQAVAAFGIVTRIEGAVYLVLMSLAIGMGPVIGQNFGARKLDRVEETLSTAIFFSVLWSFGVAALLIAFAAPIAREFTHDPLTIHIVAGYFVLIGASGALANIVNGWASAWNAMGKPQISVVLIVTSSLIGHIAAAGIGFYIASWQGMFMAFAIKNLTLGLGLHLWSNSVWKKLKSTV